MIIRFIFFLFFRLHNHILIPVLSWIYSLPNCLARSRYGAVLLQRLSGIFAACGCESARSGGEGRDAGLVEDDGQTQEEGEARRHIAGNLSEDAHSRSATFPNSFLTLFSTAALSKGWSDSQMNATASVCCCCTLSVSICLWWRYASRTWRFALLRSTACLKCRFDTLTKTCTGISSATRAVSSTTTLRGKAETGN